jgi:hypothetical protein
MDEVLTWEEIQRRYDGEWVAIAEPDVTDDLEILGGRLVYHGPDYEEAYERLRLLGLRGSLVEFVGASLTVDGAPAVL